MAKRHSPKLSGKLEEELRDRLEELLDEHDDVAQKKKRVAKALKGHLTVLDDSISLVRRQLKGEDLDQMEIPGTSMPEPTKDPAVMEILRLAGGIVERPKAEGEEPEEDDPDEKCLDCGKPANEPSPGCEECDHGRSAKGADDHTLLAFRRDPKNNHLQVMAVGGGEYRLTFGPDSAYWTAAWAPTKGAPKTLAFQKPEQECKAACRAHHLERLADEKLRNAGSGDLTRADTKGDAVARRKGAPRG